MNKEEAADYNAWKRRTLKECTVDYPYWKHIGDWMYTTKDNPAYHQETFHLCEPMWSKLKEDRDHGLHFGKCGECKEEAPEGIKMVALLESL